MRKEEQRFFVTGDGLKLLRDEAWQAFQTGALMLAERWNYWTWLQTHELHSEWRRLDAKCLFFDQHGLLTGFYDAKGHIYHVAPF